MDYINSYIIVHDYKRPYSIKWHGCQILHPFQKSKLTMNRNELSNNLLGMSAIVDLFCENHLKQRAWKQYFNAKHSHDSKKRRSCPKFMF